MWQWMSPQNSLSSAEGLLTRIGLLRAVNPNSSTRTVSAISPDPRFLFLAQPHREALAHLLYGLEHGEGSTADGHRHLSRENDDELPAHAPLPPEHPARRHIGDGEESSHTEKLAVREPREQLERRVGDRRPGSVAVPGSIEPPRPPAVHA